MAYAHATLDDLTDSLADRLSDPSGTFWPRGELSSYVVEALRTWNSLTAYHRAQGSFSTAANDPFYDLEVELSSLLDYSVADADLQRDLCRKLLEPDQIPYAGSSMFTQRDFTGALARRRDRFLYETFAVVSEDSFNLASPEDGRVSLDGDVMQIVRAEWSSGGTRTHLWREDERTITGYNRAWNSTSETPYAYSVSSSPPLTVQLFPVPSSGGDLEVLAVKSGAALDPETGVVLGVPDDFSWVIAWGAAADLTAKEGPAHDAARARWCESMYVLGTQAARAAPLVFSARVGADSNLEVNSIQDLDAYRPNWRSLPTGVPDAIGTAGRLVALSPVPSGVHTVTLDVVRNFPVPAGGDQVQIGREHLDAILDWAEHVASFKMGGEEFSRTMNLAERFLSQAYEYAAHLRARVPYLSEILSQSNREWDRRPYRKESMEVRRAG